VSLALGPKIQNRSWLDFVVLGPHALLRAEGSRISPQELLWWESGTWTERPACMREGIPKRNQMPSGSGGGGHTDVE
jgi:hypothetical protein